MRDLVAEMARLNALYRATRLAEYQAERTRVAEARKQLVNEMDQRLAELDTKISQIDDDGAAFERFLEFVQSNQLSLDQHQAMNASDGDTELLEQHGRSPESQQLTPTTPNGDSGFPNFVDSLPEDAAYSARIAAIMLDAPLEESWEKRELAQLVLPDPVDWKDKSKRDSAGRALDRMVDHHQAEKREDGRYTRGDRVADALRNRDTRPRSRAASNGHGGTVAGLSRKAMRMTN